MEARICFATARTGIWYLAEREGFEPSIGYSPIHAFQACAFNRSAISPSRRARNSNGPPSHCALRRVSRLGGFTRRSQKGEDGLLDDLQLVQDARIFERRHVLLDFLALGDRAQQPPHD